MSIRKTAPPLNSVLVIKKTNTLMAIVVFADLQQTWLSLFYLTLYLLSLTGQTLFVSLCKRGKRAATVPHFPDSLSSLAKGRIRECGQ